jgi:predicted secreted hydrolase
LLLGSAGILAVPGALAQITPDRSGRTSHAGSVPPFAQVVPGYRLRFPKDHGSHPDFRIEWWYVTGWLEPGPVGFQITFFRAKPQLKHDNPSAFAPRQVIIAHAAISDPVHGRLIHAQRAARAGFELAGADEGRTRVWVDDWSLHRTGSSYRSSIAARELSLELELAPTQQPMLQGQNGFSRKGPAPESASYYYSLPHLKVAGILMREKRIQAINGVAWLDHEWSSEYLSDDAVGWDWIGINLDDGGALMAFRMRDTQGHQHWGGGSLRRPDGRAEVFSPDGVRFIPGRRWQSTRTGTTYPVSWQVQAGDLELAIEPLFDDQEHDTRATTGAVYWEGAVRALAGGRPVGRGYLELTGYGKRLKL